MTPRLEFSSYMKARFDALNILWELKNAEYSDNSDPFKAFSEMSSGLSFHKTPEKVLWELMSKHLHSIKEYCGGKELNMNQVREKIGDIILYLMILEGIADKNNRTVNFKYENDGFNN